MKRFTFSRRSLLKSFSISSFAYVTTPKIAIASPKNFDEEKDLLPPEKPFFTVSERLRLAELCEEIFPGAVKLGAVNYIEILLNAFEYSPPKIFAGGPYSGRLPFKHIPLVKTNNFKDFLPLNRVQERAWRLRLYGSDGVPEGGPNDEVVGKITGWRELFKLGTQPVRAEVEPNSGLEITYVWGGLSQPQAKVFREVLTELTLESIFGAPEYGGNRDGEGWKVIHYEGDVQPYGYAVYSGKDGKYIERKTHPVTLPNPGEDPEPFDDMMRGFLRLMSFFSGGNKK